MTTVSTGAALELAWKNEEPPALSLRAGVAYSALWIAAVLGISPLADWVTPGLLGLDPEGRLEKAVSFFLYDAPMVLLLLVGAVFLMGIGNTYFTPERARRVLARRGKYLGHVLASLLGVVTPFCSCSAVPLFIGFVEAGIPLGVTFSFLVAAPMVNEVALVLLAGILGWRVALLYLSTGLSIAIASGVVLGWLYSEEQIEPWARPDAHAPKASQPRTFGQRAHVGAVKVRRIVKRVWLFVLIGIGIGAVIHGYVPESTLRTIMGNQQWWSVPGVVLLGIPLYSSSPGLLPIVQTLLAKGAALGTVLAFMMAAIGLSLPEVVVLRRVLRSKVLVAFVGTVGTGILLTGWLFNALF